MIVTRNLTAAKNIKLPPGIEPGTIRSAVERSTAELRKRQDLVSFARGMMHIRKLQQRIGTVMSAEKWEPLLSAEKWELCCNFRICTSTTALKFMIHDS